MVAILHAGDGAARLGAVKRRRRSEAESDGMRAALGKHAAPGCEADAVAGGLVLLH